MNKSTLEIEQDPNHSSVNPPPPPPTLFPKQLALPPPPPLPPVGGSLVKASPPPPPPPPLRQGQEEETWPSTTNNKWRWNRKTDAPHGVTHTIAQHGRANIHNNNKHKQGNQTNKAGMHTYAKKVCNLLYSYNHNMIILMLLIRTCLLHIWQIGGFNVHQIVINKSTKIIKYYKYLKTWFRFFGKLTNQNQHLSSNIL